MKPSCKDCRWSREHAQIVAYNGLTDESITRPVLYCHYTEPGEHRQVKPNGFCPKFERDVDFVIVEETA